MFFVAYKSSFLLFFFVFVHSLFVFFFVVSFVSQSFPLFYIVFFVPLSLFVFLFVVVFILLPHHVVVNKIYSPIFDQESLLLSSIFFDFPIFQPRCLPFCDVI